MHIAVLSDPNHFHTQKWVNGLLDAGQQVTVFSFFEGEIEGAKCVKLDPSFTFNGKITYLSYLCSGQKLRKALTAAGVEILNSIDVTPYGVWAAKSGFRPLVQLAMGADILEYPPKLSDLEIDQQRLYSSNSLSIPPFLQKTIFPIKWRIFRQNVAKALEASDLILGDNQQLIDALHHWFGQPLGKLQLNRWGIEQGFAEVEEAEKKEMCRWLGVEEGKKVILAPRGLKPVYQGDVILEAFGELLKTGHEDLHFVVLSAGYQAPGEILDLATSLDQKYPNFTYVKGLIPRQKMASLWGITDAFVIAPVYDGYSNALNEGRYAGAIPILNDIPAHREMMEHGRNCWMVEPFGGKELADELVVVMKEMKAWKGKFGPENRQWVEEEAVFERNIGRFLERIGVL